MHLISFDESGLTGTNLRDPVLTVKPIDLGGIPRVEPFIHVGDERVRDVNAWVTAEQKNGRPGN